MSGRILVRDGDGALQEFPIGTRVKIGSGAPSDVVIDGDGVLPLHATAEVRDEDCWIEAAAGGRIAINGQPVEKRALRHLDVITLGDRVHVIFSTSSAPLPQSQAARPKKVAAPNPAAAANATRMINRADPAPPMFTPPTAGAPAVANTIVGVPVATFTPPAGDAPPAATNTVVGVPVASFTPPPGAPPPVNTIIGMRVDVTPPAFAPQVPPTMAFQAPASAPFVPADTRDGDAATPRPITGVRLSGSAGVFEAPIGTSVIGRGSKATLRIDSKEVSRVHALLIASADGVSIEDRDSVNGTTVNGVRITGTHELAEGDLVSFGMVDLRVDFVRPGK